MIIDYVMRRGSPKAPLAAIISESRVEGIAEGRDGISLGIALKSEAFQLIRCIINRARQAQGVLADPLRDQGIAATPKLNCNQWKAVAEGRKIEILEQQIRDAAISWRKLLTKYRGNQRIA